MTIDHCPDCSGPLKVKDTTRVTWIAVCGVCGQRWHLDDTFTPVRRDDTRHWVKLALVAFLIYAGSAF